MFINLFFAVVVGFCLGYLFRAFVVPAYKNYEQVKEREEMERINNHDQYVHKVDRLLKRIEDLVVEFYGSNNRIRQKRMSDLMDNAQYLIQLYHFDKVEINWVGNKESFVINLAIDDTKYLLWGKWDINIHSGNDMSAFHPKFVPEVVLPK